MAGGSGHRRHALMASSPLPAAGKTPEDVVRRYIQKVKNPPDEVSGHPLGTAWPMGSPRGRWRLAGGRAGDGQPPRVGREPGVTSPSHPSTRARQDCTICMERLVTSSGYEGVLSHRGIKPELVGKLGKCGHMYHLLCLLAMYNNGNKVSWDIPPRLGDTVPTVTRSRGWVLWGGCRP